MKLSATFVVSAFAAALVCGLASGETSAGEAARSSAGFVESVLASHNRERARLGLPSLRWSAKLSQDAGQWAGSLARRGALEHSDGDDGENLWMGSANGYSLEQMVGAFISERRVFRPGRFPNVSRTGDWSDVGHYTQVIWPETQSVGCALARNRGQDVLVCRYWPAGNVYGERVG
jgi:uncharacterized protein YkwD